MRYLDATTIESLAPLAELVDVVDSAYRDVANGRDRSPLRAGIALSGGDLLIMPGVREGASGVSVKVVSIVAGNRELGLPTVQALVVWVDADTGTPRALLDGNALTLLRTGAGTGAATRLLSRDDSRVLAMIGAGGQAEWQVRAVCAVREIREVRVWAPSARRDELATRLGDMLAPVVVVGAAASAERAVRGADVVCCATTSSVPVLDAAWVEPGAHVNGIGAFRPGMVELPVGLFARASLVTVDSREAALAEAGDVLAAIDAGAIDASRLVEIGSLDAGARERSAVTVFKSVGLAAQDAAAAELIVRRASEAGLLD
ncbi:MAG: ornithine cyclodeaminase family protein [Candidatus Limnocylindria bacterium]